MGRVLLICILLVYGILYINRYQLYHNNKTLVNCFILNNNIIENEFIYRY